MRRFIIPDRSCCLQGTVLAPVVAWLSSAGSVALGYGTFWLSATDVRSSSARPSQRTHSSMNKRALSILRAPCQLATAVTATALVSAVTATLPVSAVVAGPW